MNNRRVGSNVRIYLLILLVLCLFVPSCKKNPEKQPAEKTKQTPPPSEKITDNSPSKSGMAPTNGPIKSGMVPIDLKLPKPVFIGTPTNIQVPNLKKPLGKPRPPFYAPAGTVNVASGKPVASTDEEPIIGEIPMITDGDKEASDGSYVELGPFLQHVTIDLGEEHTIYAIVVWHYHKQGRVYFDVVVQAAEDADFISNVQTLFNNDIDNSAGLGIGKDMHYVETAEGLLIDARATKARYVRLYSNGNNSNDLNNYIEVEVYGKAAK